MTIESPSILIEYAANELAWLVGRFDTMSEMQQRNWRVRFKVISHKGEQFDLQIDNVVVLGRDIDDADVIDLTRYDGERRGVSQRHAMIRPTLKNLFVMDLGSKHGTLKNGQSIGVKMPYPLKNGDILVLGRLQLLVQIIDDQDLAAVPERIIPHPPPKKGTAHAKLPQESDR